MHSTRRFSGCGKGEGGFWGCLSTIQLSVGGSCTGSLEAMLLKRNLLIEVVELLAKQGCGNRM